MKKLLVVDDLKDNRYMLETLLTGGGYKVTSAKNGVAAMEQLKKEAFDLIISDILMPEMDGFALCRACKSDAALVKIPFVFYTATYTDRKDEAFALGLGAEKFIIKPTEPDEFLKIVKTIFEEQRPSVAPKKHFPKKTDYLIGYNERLIHKLEQKVLDLRSEIVKRKKSEMALRMSEQRFQAIANYTYSWEIWVSPSGNFIWTNPAIERVTGYTAEECAKIHGVPFNIVYDQDKGKAALAFKPTPEVGTGDGVEFRMYRKDGTLIWVSASWHPIYDAKGFSQGYRIGISEITERKQAEEEIKNLLKSKSQFVSMVSHELRTPLTSIKEGINLVADGLMGQINEEQLEVLNISRRNVDRLARLINDILDFQKIKSGKITYNIKPNDINEIVEYVYKANVNIIGKTGLNFMLEVDNNLPTIGFDDDKIIQVLTNLVTNAINFTEKGTIKIKTSRNDNEVLVCVSDTGIGMKDEDLQRIFNSFEQLAVNGHRKTNTSGLGLAISRGIIEQHKGKIWAESEFGKGSTVTFTLPIDNIETLIANSFTEIINKASAKDEKISFFLMSIAGSDELQEELLSERMNLILADMEKVIKNNLCNTSSFRANGSVFKFSEEIMVILPNCNKETAGKMKEVFTNKLNNYLINKNLMNQVELNWRYVIYPDDGTVYKELMEKLKKSAFMPKKTSCGIKS